MDPQPMGMTHEQRTELLRAWESAYMDKAREVSAATPWADTEMAAEVYQRARARVRRELRV